MKQQHISIYTISLILFFACYQMHAQEQPIDLNERDTTTYEYRYGLRVGADLSKLTRSFFETGYQGFELVGDYRISKKFYIASELGSEEKTTIEDLYDFTTSGSYIKAGFDYNAYENWYGMENMIHAGLRYGFATLRQTVNTYTIYNSDMYWGEGGVPGANPDLIQQYDGLTAQWIEVVLGLKAELFNNVYLGLSVRLNRLITDTAAANFPNLWIPGFNKVTDGSAFGVGYNYTITYFIPLYKTKKKNTAETPGN